MVERVNPEIYLVIKNREAGGMSEVRRFDPYGYWANPGAGAWWDFTSFPEGELVISDDQIAKLQKIASAGPGQISFDPKTEQIRTVVEGVVRHK